MKLVCLTTGLHLIYDEIEYRIERILDNNTCYLERLNDGALLIKSKSEILQHLTDGEVELDGTQNKSMAHRETLDIKSLDEVKEREVERKLAYIKKAHSLLGPIPRIKGLKRCIETVKNEIKDASSPSKISVYRWWKRWVSSKFDLSSLVNLPTGKQGGRKFTKTVMQEFEQYVLDTYLNENSPSSKGSYLGFKSRIEILNLSRTDKLAIPSSAQFYRLLGAFSAYDRKLARYGKQIADEHFRSTGRGVKTKNILERVEVDHTPLDIFVMDARTGEAVGRPTLTTLIDCQSRMILGLSVGLQDCSFERVASALRMAILPKDFVKKKYKRIEHEWKAYGIPMTLICDNGNEFHSNQLKRICAELNIEIQYCPKKQAHYKGMVERFQRTLNENISHKLPGSTLANIDARGNYNSVKKAVLTLEELDEIIHEWVIDVYHQGIHRETKYTPASLWEKGLEKIEPMLPASVQQLNLIFTYEEVRSLQHYGVQLNNLFYSSHELNQIRLQSGDNLQVKVRYCPDDLGVVYVLDEISGDYIVVPCKYPEYAQGLPLQLHKNILKQAKEEGRELFYESDYMVSYEKFESMLIRISKDSSLRKRKKSAQLKSSRKKELNDELTKPTLRKDKLPKLELNFEHIELFPSRKFQEK